MNPNPPVSNPPNLADLESLLASVQLEIQKEIESDTNNRLSIQLKAQENRSSINNGNNNFQNVNDASKNLYYSSTNIIPNDEKSNSLMNLSNSELNSSQINTNVGLMNNMRRGDATLPRSFKTNWKNELEKQTMLHKGGSSSDNLANYAEVHKQRKSVGDVPADKWKEYWAK